MRASYLIGAVIVGTVSLALLSVADAQDNQVPENSCVTATDYSPARSVTSLKVTQCSKLIKLIETATDHFLDGQCKVLEALRMSIDQSKFKEANTLKAKGVEEISQSEKEFQDASGLIDSSEKIPDSERNKRAFELLKSMGQPYPETYKTAFQNLAKAIGDSAASLNKVSFRKDDPDPRGTSDAIFKATIDTGVILHSIESFTSLAA